MNCDASSFPELDLQGSVLAELTAAAAERGVSLLVIGAAARDILMTCIGLELGRATRDLDVAVAVTSMAEFEGLLSAFPRAVGRCLTCAADVGAAVGNGRDFSSGRNSRHRPDLPSRVRRA